VESNIGLLNSQTFGNRIPLRTMILVRWVAIVGQITAISVAQQLYNLQLELGLCYMAIGVSVIGNLIAIFVFPENKRLTEFENFLMVLFDLLQLALLLYLTGGLHNPFALLMLGPVTVAANVMGLRPTLTIGATAIILVTVLAQFYLPLRTEQGFILRMPNLFVFGNWIALIIAVVFMSVYSQRINTEIRSMSDALAATHMALSREQKLTDLGGVVAAAAHELGTPLATIKLTSAELIEELDDRPELREDAALIREQADRCRDILRDMGRAGKDDLHLRQAPLSTVVNEAAEPHTMRGKTVQSRIKVKRQMQREALDNAFHRFEHFERRMDTLESQLESMDIGREVSPDLAEQINALADDERISDELERLKSKMKQGGAS